jgi:hypothetical protein
MQVTWNLKMSVDASCQDYRVSITGAGLGMFAGSGSTLTQETPTCEPPGYGSDSTILFTATVNSIQTGATLTLSAGDIEINPLNAVREPATALLLVSGFACLGTVRKRRP